MPNAKDAEGKVSHRYLILGDTGSGKTTLSLTLPGKKFYYLFDSNAILSLRGQDVEYEEFLPDRLNMRVSSLSAGKVQPSKIKNTLFDEWEKDFTGRLDSGFFDKVDVIVFDSATTFLDLIMDRTLTINGRSGQWPHQDDYGPQMVTFTNVCRTLTAMGKTAYMTGHIEMRQDELTKKIYRQPMMTGRLKTKIPLLFSDIFVTEVDVDVKGNVKHLLKTTPDRTTTTIRSSLRNARSVEDVTIDWSKPLTEQGLGRMQKEDVAQ